MSSDYTLDGGLAFSASDEGAAACRRWGARWAKTLYHCASVSSIAGNECRGNSLPIFESPAFDHLQRLFAHFAMKVLVEIEGDQVPHAVALGMAVVVEKEVKVLLLLLAAGVGVGVDAVARAGARACRWARDGPLRHLHHLNVEGMTRWRVEVAQAMDAHARTVLTCAGASVSTLRKDPQRQTRQKKARLTGGTALVTRYSANLAGFAARIGLLDAWGLELGTGGHNDMRRVRTRYEHRIRGVQRGQNGIQL